MIERIKTGDRMRWVLPWAWDRVSRSLRRIKPGHHLLVAICDHFEPLHGGATLVRGQKRVLAWREEYPELAKSFSDDDGYAPRHTFFYPGEQYHPDLLEPLAELCELGLGEVELHLHHDGDTRHSLQRALSGTIRDFDRHGLLAHTPEGPKWAFIHGNWALANGRPDGRWCGVDDELELLWELGCYADFTFPSAPDVCQPAHANDIFYPGGNIKRRRSYDRPSHAYAGKGPEERVLLITGPLALAKRPDGFAYRIESSALTAKDPPTRARLRTWIDSHVHIRGRPEWVFIKLHTHGAPEPEARSLLGLAQHAFHEELNKLRGEGYFVHYVTAREMFNIAVAAIEGRSGSPGAYRDHIIPKPNRAGKHPVRWAKGGSARIAPAARRFIS